jgi:hypothetical protein
LLVLHVDGLGGEVYIRKLLDLRLQAVDGRSFRRSLIASSPCTTLVHEG